MSKTGLILEGGATRGVFTSGVLDCLMENEIHLPYIVGVSAGACNGTGYVSWQKGRTKKCMMPPKEHRYVAWRNIVTKRSLYDMDMLFDKYPKEIYPFDYETFFASDKEFEMVVTNCITGGPEYLSEKEDGERLMQICKASCSLPFVSPIVEIDGIPYLDGGLADSIPAEHALEKGCDKLVAVLTRKRGYRKPPLSRKAQAFQKLYHNYPNLLDAMNQRHVVYNESLELLEEMERRGRAFIIRPEGKLVSKTETDRDSMLTLYNHGYRMIERRMDELRNFLQE